LYYISNYCGIIILVKGVIYLVEFCTCGSLIIGGHCTNKNCADRASKPTQVRAPKAKKEPKTTRVRKSSKSIVYNLYDTEKEEGDVN